MNRKVYEAELLNSRKGGAAGASNDLTSMALTTLGPPALEALEKVVTSAVIAHRDVAMLRAQSEAELAKLSLEAQEAADIRAKAADLTTKKIESFTELAKTALENDAPEAFHTLLDKISEAGV